MQACLKVSIQANGRPSSLKFLCNRILLTGLCPLGDSVSITGSCLSRFKILAAETLALLTSGAKEKARPSCRAVNITAANTLQINRWKKEECIIM